MKSILIIGMGRFGSHLCRDMAKLGNEIMVVDENEELLEPLLPYVVSAKIGDCTKEEVLRSLGVDNFDICFVCIGTNFQSSLEITSLLKDIGAKYVISKATRDVHAKFLLRNGADEIIYPDRDIAEKCAVSYSMDNLFDNFELTKGYSIYEIAPPSSWIGKTIVELDIRNNYHANIIAIKSNDEIQILPPVDYRFHENEHIMILGHKTDLQKLVKNKKP